MKRLHEVTIEGFRAFNARRSFRFGDKLTVFYGPGGSGKTSVLQAIQWAIFDSLPQLRVPEAKLEDPIVNKYHPRGIAHVRLIFDDGYAVSRVTKRLRKRPGVRGYSEAEPKDFSAEEQLGLTIQDFMFSCYLRQETIRNFIGAKPEDRPDILSRLLGLEYLRILAEGVENGLKDATEVENRVSRECEDVEGNLLRFKKAQEQLQHERRRLLETGIDSEDISFSGLRKLSQQIEKAGQALARILDETWLTGSLGVPTTITEATSFERKAQSRTDRYQELIQERRNKTLERVYRLTSLRERYSRCLERVLGMSRDELEARINELSVELQELRETRKRSEGLLEHLLGLVPRFESTRYELNKIGGRIHEIERTYGSEAHMQGWIRRLTQEIGDIERECQTRTSYVILLERAEDYLRDASPSICPVCEQGIDPNVVAEKVASRRRSLKETKELEELKRRLSEGRQRLESLNAKLGKLKELTARRYELLSHIRWLRESAEKSLRKALPKEEDPVAFLKRQISTLKEQNDKLARLIEDLTAKLGETRRALETFLEFSQIERGAQQELRTETAGSALLFLLDSTIENLNGDLRKLEDAEGRLRQLGELLRQYRDIRSLLGQELMLEERPPSEDEVERCRNRFARVKEFRGQLTGILEAVRRSAKRALDKQLKDLKPSLEKWYGRLRAHNFFRELRLMYRDGKLYFESVSAHPASKTYVLTTFSASQLNKLAIATALAISEKCQLLLDFLMIDDPTQSLDDGGKLSLAEVLREACKVRQLIIATQDRDFVDHLKRAVPEALVYEFEGWSAEEGPLLKS